MGLGDFFKSAAGAIGTVGGTLLGGPVGGFIGGSIGGSISNAHQNKKQFERDQFFLNNQQNFQREFAKKGIQYRVQDAKAAGIHPLAALGAQTYNASPSVIGGTPLVNESANMSRLGQDISRAIASQTTNYERQIMELNLKNVKMDTEMKALELTQARRRLNGQVGPGIPDSTVNKPAEITSHAKGKPHLEAGSITSTGFSRGPDGALTPVPSKDVKERIEDQFIPEVIWAGQNYVSPAFGGTKNKPPKKLLPKGFKDWEWSVTGFKWVPTKGKGRSPMRKLYDKYKKFIGY